MWCTPPLSFKLLIHSCPSPPLTSLCGLSHSYIFIYMYFQDQLLNLLFPHPAGTQGIPLVDSKRPESATSAATGTPVLPPVLQAIVESVGSKPAKPQSSGKAKTMPGSIPLQTITWSTYRHAAAPWPWVRPRVPGNGRNGGRREGGNQQQWRDRKLPVTELGEEMRTPYTDTKHCPNRASLQAGNNKISQRRIWISGDKFSA